MSYGSRLSGGGGYRIKTFWPDELGNVFFITGEKTLDEIIDRAMEKWPSIQLSEISIESEYIQTDSLNADIYDSSNWTNFIKIVASDNYINRTKI